MKRLTRWLLWGALAVFSLGTPLEAKSKHHVQGQGFDGSLEVSYPTPRSPIGRQRGLKELAAVLAASDPTATQTIRRVVIFLPKEMPDAYRPHEAGNTAIREFFLIAGSESLKRDSKFPPNPTFPEGIKEVLPNGGTITLKFREEVEGKRQRMIGQLRLQNHGIQGYAAVTQIEFMADAWVEC